MHKNKTFPKYILVLVLFLAANLYASEPIDKDKFYPADALDLDLSEILDAEEVNDMYSDKKITGFNRNTNERYTNEYYTDGTVKSKRKDKTWKGIWYIDPVGKHCIRWYHKDTSNCELIGQDDEGNWVKFKDNEITKEIERIEDLPGKTKKK